MLKRFHQKFSVVVVLWIFFLLTICTDYECASTRKVYSEKYKCFIVVTVLHFCFLFFCIFLVCHCTLHMQDYTFMAYF